MKKLLLPFALLAAAGAACSQDRTPTAAPTATTTSSPEATTTPAPATEAWVFYEKKTAAVESDANRSLGFFRRRLPDGTESPVALAAAERVWYPSPDGRMIAAVEGTGSAARLKVAAVEELPRMRDIGSGRDVTSLLWGSDRLFVITAEAKDTKEPPETGLERLFEVPLNGSERRLVTMWNFLGGYTVRALLAHDTAKGELLWTEETREGAGGSGDLYATAVADGRTRKLLSFETGGVRRLAVAPDGSYAYIVRKDTQIVEMHTADRAERVIYRVDGKNETAIEDLQITRDGKRLVFLATQASVIGPSADTKTPRTTTYVVALPGADRTQVFSEVRDRHAHHHVDLAPDGRFLWLWESGTDASDYFVLEVATKRKIPIASEKGERATTVWLLGWLDVPAGS